MIGIITYTSVLERTEKIGDLKRWSCTRKKISLVSSMLKHVPSLVRFTSGALRGVLIWVSYFPNQHRVLYNMTELENVAQLNPVHGLILILVSKILTMIGGHISARMAAKDAAIALRDKFHF